ncbi:MAG: phosphotransferase, partial [Bacteroidota bacterium]
MTNKLYATDIRLMLQLFCGQPYEVYVFDPKLRLIWDDPEELEPNFPDGTVRQKVLINLGGPIQQYKHYALTDFDYVLEFGATSPLPAGYQCSEYRYLNNADGTMRWWFSPRLKAPTFLSLYNSNTRKGRWFRRIMRMLYATRAQRFFLRNGFRIATRKPTALDEVLAPYSFESYSVFTGTVGPNRKLLLELNTNGQTTHFVKVAISLQSLKLIQAESRVLHAMNRLGLRHLEVPKALPGSDMAVQVMTNLRTRNSRSTGRITSTHAKALEEVYAKTGFVDRLDWTSFHAEILRQMSQLKQQDTRPELRPLLPQLQALAAIINKEELLPVARCHGDFTPWNMFVTPTKLQVYDWEMGQRSAPMLFDLFHFIFQGGV